MNVSSRIARESDRPGTTRVVGLGASAGGLEALEQFLAQVPAGSGLAYVVVQHLDPTHKAMLVELLQRATLMPVREAAESMRVEPDVVYVIPPNNELSVVRGLLHLAQPSQPRGMRLPIDVLFCSLAREQGDRAIGVVLSGMGSDGTLGLQAIKAQGGLTLAQQPESAQFDSMPASAIAAGSADIVAPPAELPARILRVLAAQHATSRHAEVADDGSPPVLHSILELLREHSKHDLSLYKTSTLQRRVERRMGVHGLDTMAAYEEFLRQNPRRVRPAVQGNADRRDRLLPRSGGLAGSQGRPHRRRCWRSGAEGRRLRAWVVGCSTGEEAYSLAMVFKEAVDALPAPDSCTLQIFATDLSVDAIAVARKGHYPARIAEVVSPERLARFFDAEGDGFRVEQGHPRDGAVRPARRDPRSAVHQARHPLLPQPADLFQRRLAAAPDPVVSLQPAPGRHTGARWIGDGRPGARRCSRP